MIEQKLFELVISEGIGHSVDLVDATDNGSFLFAEVQVAGHRIGDIDIQALGKLRVCDVQRHMSASNKLMKQELMKLSFADSFFSDLAKESGISKDILTGNNDSAIRKDMEFWDDRFRNIKLGSANDVGDKS